jgi:hypothetical protein
MNNKFDNVLKKFLKEEDSQMTSAMKLISPAQNAIKSLPINKKPEAIAGIVDALTQTNANNNNNPNQQKQIESFKKLLDTTGQNASYNLDQFTKDNPELKDHPHLKSLYNSQSTPSTTPNTTPSTTPSTTPNVAGSKNAFNGGAKQ